MQQQPSPPHSPSQIKEKLLKALDRDYHVRSFLCWLVATVAASTPFKSDVFEIPPISTAAVPIVVDVLSTDKGEQTRENTETKGPFFETFRGKNTPELDGNNTKTQLSLRSFEWCPKQSKIFAFSVI